MLDIDGHVISAAELISRVDQLLGEREASPATPPEPPLRASSGAPVSSDLRSGVLSRLRRILTRRGPGPGRSPATTHGTELDVDELDRRLGSLDSQLSQCLGALDVLRRQNVSLRMQLADVEVAVQEPRLDRNESNVASLRREVATVLERLGAASSSGADIDYAGFEDRFRGTTDDVRQSQKRYLSLFPDPSTSGIIVDIGCGRGEMVELLIEAGHNVLGVDMDANMIRACESKGIPARQGDALHFLESTPSDSLKGIFCAQVVEHLLTSELERLLRLSHKKLRTGGVLLVETINPRSLYALGNHFFADTSHVRPVHPETLRFLCEQIGFKSVQMEERAQHELTRLAEGMGDDDLGKAVASLLHTVYGYQDYVVIATK